jgi:hypothetical protein
MVTTLDIFLLLLALMASPLHQGLFHQKSDSQQVMQLLYF